jgi:hypothetical protein
MGLEYGLSNESIVVTLLCVGETRARLTEVFHDPAFVAALPEQPSRTSTHDFPRPEVHNLFAWCLLE